MAFLFSSCILSSSFLFPFPFLHPLRLSRTQGGVFMLPLPSLSTDALIVLLLLHSSLLFLNSSPPPVYASLVLSILYHHLLFIPHPPPSCPILYHSLFSSWAQAVILSSFFFPFFLRRILFFLSYVPFPPFWPLYPNPFLFYHTHSSPYIFSILLASSFYLLLLFIPCFSYSFHIISLCLPLSMPSFFLHLSSSCILLLFLTPPFYALLQFLLLSLSLPHSISCSLC